LGRPGSVALNRELVGMHGGPVSGKTVEEDGLLTMWTFWALAELEPHTVRIVVTYDNEHENTDAGKATIDVACRSMKRPLAVLEKHLANKEWILGDRFTVADLNIAEVLRYGQTQQALFDAHPKVNAWLKRCQSRPAYLAMQAIRSKEPV
ncbi:glutathione S-transferase family protein, partial [Rhizobium sp. SEMIA 4085]|uniref:glutathione binding-like protein n=1 Tax=Rhizobium sp. SEMIA 4085 TaxID=2137761 RepID=UPI0014781946